MVTYWQSFYIEREVKVSSRRSLALEITRPIKQEQEAGKVSENEVSAGHKKIAVQFPRR